MAARVALTSLRTPSARVVGGLFWNRSEQNSDQATPAPPVCKDASKTEQLRSWSEQFGAFMRSFQFQSTQYLPRRTSLYNDSIMTGGSLSSPPSPSVRPRVVSRENEQISNFLNVPFIPLKFKPLNDTTKANSLPLEEDLYSAFERKSRYLSTVLINVSGISKADRGDMLGAAMCFADAASASLPSGLFNLGLCHHLGKGVPANLEKAMRCYELAASRGHAGASLNLASLLIASGRTQNATKWLQQACHLGNDEACVTLGLYLLNGKAELGLHRDTEKGFALLRDAAGRQHGEALYYVGVCYHTGVGVPRDISKARGALQAALDVGETRAAALLRCLPPIPTHEPASGSPLQAPANASSMPSDRAPIALAPPLPLPRAAGTSSSQGPSRSVSVPLRPEASLGPPPSLLRSDILRTQEPPPARLPASRRHVSTQSQQRPRHRRRPASR